MNNKFDAIGWFFERVFRYKNKCMILVLKPFVYLMAFIKGVKVGNGVDFNGLPLFRRYENSSISIGDHCTFNSGKHSVRVRMQNRCTFVTLRKNSEIIIGNNSGGTGITVLAAKKIQIGNNVLIGINSMIIDTDFHNPDPTKRLLSTDIPARPIVIEDNVFIGANCMILKGITIGENSVVGANSVVINNIPKNSISIGNPCKVVIIKNWDQSHK